MIQTNKDILDRVHGIRDRDEDLTSMDVERIEETQIAEDSKQKVYDGLLMLPSNLFNFVCMCLKAKEIVNLMCTSRAMKEKVLTQAQYALSTIALKFFFSNEIDGYVEYGYEDKYLACKSQRNNLIAEYMKHNVVEQLRKYSKLRSQIQQTPQVADLDLMFTDILNPPMPIMKIRRENVGMHAHSWFQHKLVDVYCDKQAKTSKAINQFNFANQALKKIGQGVVCSQVGGGPLGSNQFSASSSSSSLGVSSSSSFTTSAQKSIGFFTNHYGAQQKKLKFFSQSVSDIQQKLISQKQMKQNCNINTSQFSPSSSEFDNNNCFLGIAANHQEQVQQISPQRVEDLLDLVRWYRDFDEIQLITDQSNPDIQRYIQDNQVVLTVLLASTIFKNQCQFFFEYLQQNSNHATYFDLISEYNLKWNIYQAAVIEAQENLEEVYKTFNDLYQAEVGVKMYPQYSLLRVAAQHWSRVVLKPLKEKLFDAFFNLLQNRRLENLSYIITGDQQRIDPKLIAIYYMPEKLENISSDLIQRFQRLTLQNSLQSGTATSDNNRCFSSLTNDKMYQEFFSKNSYFVDNMLVTFCENMMDLSVNEASVHWLGHTDMQVGQIYSDLHQNFLQKTQIYYEELYNHVFSGHLIEWKQFLMGELKYCRKIVKESTFKLTNKLVLDNFFKAFQRDIEVKFATVQNNLQTHSSVSIEESNLKMKLMSKGLSQQASVYILNDQKSRRLLDAFEKMKDEEDEFNSKSVRDEDIEDINRYRQIKQKLDEESFAFYDLIGNIDRSLIEKTKNLIRQKLQKQNENSQNLQKQNNLHSHNNTHYGSHQSNHHIHSNDVGHHTNNNGHHNHHHHLNTNNPTHYNGSHFLALQNPNNNHFHHHFSQQGQQAFQLTHPQQQQQQNQYAQQIDDLLLFSQSFLNNNNNYSNTANTNNNTNSNNSNNTINN